MAEQKRFRKLFQGLDDMTAPRERRAYVRDEMIQAIQSGDWSLTEWMNQRPAAKQIIGDIIFGHGVSDGSDGFAAMTHVTSYPVPQPIADARVNIEATDGRRNIAYVDGSRPIEGIVVGTGNRFNVPQVEENLVDLGTYKASVPLRTAWLVLKRHGEYVVRAELKADQDLNWRYREAPARVEQPAKRGPREDRASV